MMSGTFLIVLVSEKDRCNLEATNNVYIGNGRRVRGFMGLELLAKPNIF